ncbi:hypothetical protein [Moraxella oculi]|uniref:Uncharacterized protein n=1 Tax=Moraxella oculi TaxID=2940516 RepID=A0ABW8U6I1_9GAMM
MRPLTDEEKRDIKRVRDFTMKILTWVIQAIATIILMVIVGFYFYHLYKPKQIDPYRQANPYLYNYKYYNPPTKEEMSQLVDRLANDDQSYDGQFYSRKGGFSDSGFSREFMYDKTDERTKMVDNASFIRLKVSKGYIYCKDEIRVEFGMRKNHVQQKEKFFVRVSWAADNKCRTYWWGGKNPRALQQKP